MQPQLEFCGDADAHVTSAGPAGHAVGGRQRLVTGHDRAVGWAGGGHLCNCWGMC